MLEENLEKRFEMQHELINNTAVYSMLEKSISVQCIVNEIFLFFSFPVKKNNSSIVIKYEKKHSFLFYKNISSIFIKKIYYYFFFFFIRRNKNAL